MNSIHDFTPMEFILLIMQGFSAIIYVYLGFKIIQSKKYLKWNRHIYPRMMFAAFGISMIFIYEITVKEYHNILFHLFMWLFAINQFAELFRLAEKFDKIEELENKLHVKNIAMILIVSFLMLSCGARTSSVQKQSEKLETSAEQKTETKTETQSEKSGETSYNLATDFMDFNIEPVNGIPAVFTFNYNGQKITGETTGKLNFSNEKKNEQVQTKYTEVIKTINQIVTVFKTHTTYKKDSKNKDTERSPYPWYFFVGIGFFLNVLVKYLWNWAKKSQWYLSVIGKIKTWTGSK